MGGFCSYFRKTQAKILILGLDAAGKTTLLYKLKLGEIVTTIPTIGFNVEVLKYKNLELTAWDVGGRDKMRPLLRHYYPNTDVIIYIFDANDDERLDIAKAELHGHLNDDILRESHFIILANKWDLVETNKKERDLKYYYDALGLESCQQNIYLFKICATSGDGFNEMFDYLFDVLQNNDIHRMPQTFTVNTHKSEAILETNTTKMQKMWHFFKSILFEIEDKAM